MRQTSTRNTVAIASAAAALIVSLPPFSSQAALTDISNNPMYSANVTTVKPNLLLTVDTSGSMGSDYMPDNASPDQSSDFGETSSTAYNCLYQGAGNNQGNNNCSPGDPPYYANQYNFVAYNPTFTYTPGVNYDGSSKGNITNFTSVPNDAYNSGAGTISLLSGTTGSFTEQVYANSAGTMKRNGEVYCPYNSSNQANPCMSGNVPPPQGSPLVTVTSFAYATPAKPSVTGVSISGFGTGTIVTGTIASNTIAVGDVIDVLCTSPSTFPLANAVPVLTSTTSSFTFTAGYNWGSSACTKATINYSVVGYPEQADSSGYAYNFNPSTGSWTSSPIYWSITVPTTTSGVTNSSKTVTVNFYNHGLTVGDVITVTGGSSNCTATNTSVTKVTLGTGVNAAVPVSFQYKVGSSSACSGTYTFKRQAYNQQISGGSPPFYYTITPTEYCADRHLTTCSLPAAGGVAPAGYPYPAYMRYCKAQTGANSAASAPAITGPSASPTAPYCQNKYLFGAGYIYPRYGTFTRTDILTTNTYPNYAGRTDCGTGPTCTGTLEATNFANWYTYYRTRLQMMKTLIGQALVNLSSSYRVGFIIINPDGNSGNPITSSNPVKSSSYVPVSDFTSTQKQTLYNNFYSQKANNSTPLRSALARAGRYFAGKHDYINSGMSDDPVQYSCQQNFVLLTTDGYWNTNGNGDKEAVGLDGQTVLGDQDNSTAFKSAGDGTYEGDLGVDYSQTPPKVLSTCQAGTYAKGGCANTLADVATYYYNTDLRPTGSTNSAGTDVSQDNVPTTPTDPASWQHMTTFTLGLADGLMTWQNNYANISSGDFYSITSGATGCWWPPTSGGSTTLCQWPVPLDNSPTALDDLWHAAVNGHGVYYHGTNPKSVASGITNALSEINVRLSSAAAAATSSPQITQTNNFIYSSTYDTVQWSGDIQANTIDPSTGQISVKPIWDSAVTLDTQVGPASDSRTIYTYDAVNKILKPFLWANLTATEQTSFANICLLTTPLTQCPTLTPAQVTQTNDGYDLLNYIRGWRGNEGVETGSGIFRTRVHVLGDTVDAQPSYVGSPPYGFTDPGYASFQTLNATRQPVLYVGANDGMLHAFNANGGTGSTGNELWAYVPRMLFSKLYMLADSNYANLHQFYVDGTPATMDAYYAGAWHTVLVGGLNSGGRGYYALDITNPTSPKLLWEFCSDSTLCGTANSDADMGLTYGTPIITKRALDGKWVVLVTSGYNNVSPGTGQGFLYVLDLVTGTVLQKLGTGMGTTTSPSGLARFAAWADNPLTDNTTKYVYAGDLQGNVWRFDLTSTTAAPNPLLLGNLTDASNKPQPVTTRPELGTVQGFRVVYIGTGEFLGNSDVSNANTQSLYAFKDKGMSYGNIRTNANLVQQTLTTSSSTVRTVSNNTVNWGTNNGWYVDFPTAGERMNVDPQLVLGTLLVATNIPGASACTTGGSSWFYEFDYASGHAVSTAPGGQVGWGNPNALTVGFVIIQLPSGQTGGEVKDSTGKDKYAPIYTGAQPLSGKRQGWRQL